MTGPLDLGYGHTLRYTAWVPDRALNPQYADLPNVERVGAIVAHTSSDPACSPSGECEGSILFDSEVTRRVFPGRPCWTVTSWEPLTLSPSLLCHCGDHGFVREGRWVPV